MQPQPPQKTINIHADLYPAKITYHNGQTHDPVKILIGHDTIWIYTINGNTGTHIATHPLDHLTGTNQHGYKATINGQTATITRSTNCGCGNSRSWKPFPYKIAMTAIPRK